MYQKEGKRKSDRKMLDYVLYERDGACMYGLFGKNKSPCFGGLDPHHIIPRSANGKDEPENLIALCRGHHDLAELNIITQEELKEILTYVNGYKF